MNYYIRGNKEKADKIKAAFEKLGIDVLDFGFADKATVYFSIGGCVQCVPYSINIMNILHSHPDYKELELPKPKFKVGDWIANDYCAGKVIALTDDAYLLDSGQGIPFSCEHNAHLWTIADAKNGDVLVCSEGSIFIYNGKCGQDTLGAYGGVICYGFDIASSYDRWTPIYGVKPATKEQCDTLFAKMKEAGYQWDADKKELRKIQHYDISNFHAGMPVLVRADNDCSWDYSVFSRITGNEYWRFAVCNGVSFTQCIPYNDDTKHLLGTTDTPSEEYINW